MEVMQEFMQEFMQRVMRRSSCESYAEFMREFGGHAARRAGVRRIQAAPRIPPSSL